MGNDEGETELSVIGGLKSKSTANRDEANDNGDVRLVVAESNSPSAQRQTSAAICSDHFFDFSLNTQHVAPGLTAKDHIAAAI